MQMTVVILDGLEDLGISICRLNETLALLCQYMVGPSSGRVDESDHPESRTEFVLEAERMAEWRRQQREREIFRCLKRTSKVP
jgi:hypothetical protein